MIQPTPLVSVLIPTYNRSKLLLRSLDSVLAQSYGHWQIIVVDDGSTDDTRSALASYRNRHSLDESRFLYLYQENQGKSVALNRGIQELRTDWVAFLDSDDVWLPEKLEQQWAALQSFGEGYGACFTDGRYVNTPAVETTVFARVGRVCDTPTAALNDATDLVLQDRGGIVFPSIFMRTSLLKKTGGFDPYLRIAEDRDFTYRLTQATSLCFVNEPLVEIDRTPGRAVGLIELLSAPAVLLDQHLYLYRKWLDACLPDDHRRREMIRRSLQTLHSQMVNQFLALGDYRVAREQAERAYRTLPGFRYWAKWRLTTIAPGLIRRIYGNSVLATHR